MFEPHSPGLPWFDFDEIADHLLEQGPERSPSELHGALCGLLAGARTPPRKRWPILW